MTAALFATYFAVMGAKCALPSTLGMLTAEGSGMVFPSSAAAMAPQQHMARVLTMSTVAIAVGKFLLGPVVDRFGGVLCLRVALSTIAACLGIIASAARFEVFAREFSVPLLPPPFEGRAESGARSASGGYRDAPPAARLRRDADLSPRAVYF